MEVFAEIRYNKLRQIGVGQGVNSCVFLARDLQTDAEIAVKEIPKARLHCAPDEYFREAKAMQAAKHPNIAEIQYACQTDDLICLAMPYYRNGSLHDRIQTNPLRLGEVLRIGDQILAGLERIHIAGFIHFDLKPSNILFSDGGGAMITDFGQTCRIGPKGFSDAPYLYPLAVPPEAATVNAGIPQSDIYQVGLTLYRAVNGDPMFVRQRPATAEDCWAAAAAGVFPDRRLFQPHVPNRLRRIFCCAMELVPADRFASASDFADELGKVPISLDWQMDQSQPSVVTWRAIREGAPEMVVEATLVGRQKWSVEVRTERVGKPKRLKRDLCADPLPEGKAWKHLKKVFGCLR